MIVSVHLADVGLLTAPRILRKRPRPSDAPGLTYAEPVAAASLRSGESLPKLKPGRVGLIAAWEDDAALDRFLDSHPLAAQLATGWHVRLEPLRVFGAWAGMPGLPGRERPVDDDETVAVLTLGRPRLSRLRPFLRSSAPAERDAVRNPSALVSTGLARPPRLVSTFSVWRSAAAMREYAHGRSGTHQAAVRADREQQFHRESAFIRFRPYASRGLWDGRDPLAAT